MRSRGRGAVASRAAKRERILRAAIRVFSRKGFFNARISEIARAAGVADGTIYLYFKSKDDLLTALFEEKMREVVADLRRRVAGGEDDLTRLWIFIRNHMDLLVRGAGLVGVLLVEIRKSNRLMKEDVAVRLHEYLDVIGGILEEGKRAGAFRADLDVTLARRAVFGALDEISLACAPSRKRRVDPAEAASSVFRIFAEGLCAPDRPERRTEHDRV
jgi:TetR/AcrR family transcriptional regulator, fatty acid metabolism regulator protein